MKTKNSIKNSFFSVITNLSSICIGLIFQAVFLKCLGSEYLGLNGLFSNIISMLGIVELGLGSAITYNLYKPLQNNDNETIKSLMLFYKKAYSLIALVIMILGLLITPFLGYFIKDLSINVNIYIVFLLFILDIVFSYLMSYKRSILYADQKNYIINIIHIFVLVFLNIIQIMFLLYTHNYYLYLVIKIVFRIVENYIIDFYVNNYYTYITDKDVKELDSEIKKDIIIKVKALFFHKIGGFIVSGTDNIIISTFLGISTVGLYSNYYLIINSVQTLFGQAIVALTPSVGHMLVEEDKTKSYSVFQKVRFANFWLATFAGTSILVIMENFICLWIGSEYLLKTSTLIILVINFFMMQMRNSYSTFKEAAGIYYEDRFVPIIESILNIVFSIILVKYLGIDGVFIGTIISGLCLWCFSYPKYVYKNLFSRTYKEYTRETLGYFILFIIISLFTFYISKLFFFTNPLYTFFLNILLCLIIPNMIIIIIFRNNNNFIYYKNLIFKLFHKKMGR
jgi:O-antigen/teichoic acid export membrane protein